MQIRRLTFADEAMLQNVAACFDGPIKPDAARRFLETENHHIFVAFGDGGDVAGFVTAVETTHPDKGTEMFVYELAVNEAHQRKGFGTQLVEALADFARKRHCYGMWVLTDDDNTAALATYNAAGGVRESQPVMLSWQFAEPS